MSTYKDNNKKILKDVIFDNEELLKRTIRDEFDIAYDDFTRKIRLLAKKYKKRSKK